MHMFPSFDSKVDLTERLSYKKDPSCRSNAQYGPMFFGWFECSWSNPFFLGHNYSRQSSQSFFMVRSTCLICLVLPAPTFALVDGGIQLVRAKAQFLVVTSHIMIVKSRKISMFIFHIILHTVAHIDF